MTAAKFEPNRIPFNFTYFAMKLLGKNLYSNPWTAISELVANGIDSKAETVHVLVDMRDKEHAVVEIFDDGEGCIEFEVQKDRLSFRLLNPCSETRKEIARSLINNINHKEGDNM